MARMVYVESEEEITDLVERIRDLGDEPGITFVLPGRSRVLQSVLNVRLLQQYARSFVKAVAVVSGDPRVQSLVHEAGMAAYASPAAYEKGVEATPAAVIGAASAEDADDGAMVHHDHVAAAAAASAPVGEPAAAVTPPSLPVHPPDAEAPAATAAGAATATAVAPPAVPPPRRAVPVAAPPRRPGNDRRRAYTIAAGGLFLVGMLLLLLAAPTAKVTITLKATPVKEDGLTVQGTTDQNAARGPLHVLTVSDSSDANAAFDFKATGQKQIPAATATAQVQFATDVSAGFCIPISRGQVIAESGSLKWAATDTPAPDRQCPSNAGYVYVPGSVSFSPPSKLIAVTAQTQGAAGNVGGGAINHPDDSVNPCGGSQTPGTGPIVSCVPKDFTVTNPQAAAGGADAKTLTVVQDSDVAAFRQQVTQVTQSLSSKVQQAILAKHPGLAFAIDPTKSGLTIAPTVSPQQPNSGDQAPADQQVTVSVHGQGTLYNPGDVRNVLIAKLTQDVGQVVPGAVLDSHYETVGNPIVQQASDDGTAVFSISGSADALPLYNIDTLKAGFTGKSSDTVKKMVRDQFANLVIDVQVSQSLPLPFLPLFSSRIELHICAREPNIQC